MNQQEYSDAKFQSLIDSDNKSFEGFTTEDVHFGDQRGKSRINKNRHLFSTQVKNVTLKPILTLFYHLHVM